MMIEENSSSVEIQNPTMPRKVGPAAFSLLAISIALITVLGRVDDADAAKLDLAKQRNLIELGGYVGGFFPGDRHELYDYPTVVQQPYENAAVDFGLRVGYLPLSWLGAEIEGGLMPTSLDNDESALLYSVRAHLIAQFPRQISPFVVVGSGILGVSSDNQAAGDDIDYAFHWGVGVKYYVMPQVMIRADGRHIVSKGLGKDRRESHFEALGGISFVLGWDQSAPQVADTDGDGVMDDIDACPTEAAATQNGCPPGDSDGDGVSDDKDACPNEAANTENGCPLADSDGDGISNDKDACPNEAAKTKNGCPVADADGDGVPDTNDKCPNQAANTPDGCPPDTDGDGVVDADDKCVDKPETQNGFEDSDGCPDELPKQVERFSGVVRGITFASGSDKIRARSFSTLRAAVKVLKDYPELRVRLRGHTDNTGTHTVNMELSLRRASAVKAFLVSKGVEADRLLVEGVGPDEPVADNTTRRGRGRNRRIEFKLISGAEAGHSPASPASTTP